VYGGLLELLNRCGLWQGGRGRREVTGVYRVTGVCRMYWSAPAWPQRRDLLRTFIAEVRHARTLELTCACGIYRPRPWSIHQRRNLRPREFK